MLVLIVCCSSAIAALLWFLFWRVVDTAKRSVISIELEKHGQLKSLQPEDFDEAAACMAEAFVDSPWYAFIFKDQQSKRERIAALAFTFTRNLALLFSKDPYALWGMRDDVGGSFKCCFLLCNPSVRYVTKIEMLRAGVLRIGWLFGFGALRRIVAVSDYVEKIEKLTIPDASRTWQVRLLYFFFVLATR
jgi:hypothetical protein